MTNLCVEPRLIGAIVERRKAIRFLLGIPVIFKWSGEQGQPHEGSGFARDISTAGIFVMTDVLPPFGAAIDLEVLLPPLQRSAHSLRLNAPGIVLRIVSTGEVQGFAATSDFAAIAGEAGSGSAVY
jgi:hypothetical protein